MEQMNGKFQSIKSLALQSLTYGTPVGLGALSGVMSSQYDIGLTANILIPVSVVLIYCLIWALMEIQNSRQDIKQLTESIKDESTKRYLLPQRLRYRVGDHIENEDWYFLYNYSVEAKRYDELIHIISNKIGVNLSSAAKELLLIPILEQFQIKGELGYEEVEKSLNKLIYELKYNPSIVDLENGEKKTTLSVIKSFWIKFCDIPPFCSMKDNPNYNDDIRINKI